MGVESKPSKETGAKAEGIKRPKRVARKTFATEETVFKSNSRQFGEILLRKDHDAKLDLTPKQKLEFIRACVRYAVMYGRIDVLKDQLAKQEKIIRQSTDAYEGLRGVESQRLDVSVTDVSEVKLNPDVKNVREASGSAFPQFGTEQVIATITVPEDVQPSGETITADRIIEFSTLALRFMGMSKETIETNAGFERRMNVTDREALFNAVNDGLIPESAISAKKSKRVEIKRLTQAPKP